MWWRELEEHERRLWALENVGEVSIDPAAEFDIPRPRRVQPAPADAVADFIGGLLGRLFKQLQ